MNYLPTLGFHILAFLVLFAGFDYISVVFRVFNPGLWLIGAILLIPFLLVAFVLSWIGFLVLEK